MTLNIGRFDRIIRVVLGAFLIIAPLTGGISLYQSTLLAIISAVVGVVLIATAAFRFCPLYRMIGIRTCKV
ncbi:Protein of unknown function [Monaibacterium marinum]|uniref:Inner membrane protein YgaP-like transmembrane domain-containing protein n=1 Tax=Pontivivens marinum TaxID=1690039 RepID=A0A2C9CR53_9RHOB|nr:DUF2892 domain-containing protein [Monaibacterium marinum]SOH93824.1 Protein of unknown function [Monaibacterium marinum]